MRCPDCGEVLDEEAQESIYCDYCQAQKRIAELEAELSECETEYHKQADWNEALKDRAETAEAENAKLRAGLEAAKMNIEQVSCSAFTPIEWIESHRAAIDAVLECGHELES